VRDSKALAEMLATLTSSNLLDRRDEIGEYVREAFDLPDMPEEEEAEKDSQAAPQPQITEDTEVEDIAAAVVGAREAALSFAEGAMPDELREAEDEFRDEGAEILDAMVRQYLAKLRPLAEQRQWAHMSEVRVPLVGKYRNWLRRYLMAVTELGRNVLAEARDVAEPPPIPNELRSWIRAQAESLANYHAGILAFAAQQTLMNDVQGGMNTDAALRNALAVGTGTLNRQVEEDLLAASEIAVQRLQE